MQSGKFEAHITTDKSHSDIVKKIGNFFGWKLEGEESELTLTCYNKDSKALYMDMVYLAEQLEGEGVPVLRQKIEEILFDSKTKVNRI